MLKDNNQTARKRKRSNNESKWWNKTERNILMNEILLNEIQKEQKKEQQKEQQKENEAKQKKTKEKEKQLQKSFLEMKIEKDEALLSYTQELELKTKKKNVKETKKLRHLYTKFGASAAKHHFKIGLGKFYQNLTNFLYIYIF